MNPLDGLLLIDKAQGLTSHDVVARARRILSTKSVGHCGTLDPLAQGLMVLLVGEATKLSQYILEGDKSYRVKLQLGKRTDTFDSTGKVLEESPVMVLPAEVEIAALKFQGEFDLPVPIYSAVKVAGQKLYDYARNDEAIVVPKKLMKFWDVRAVQEVGQAHPIWSFDLTCSKGTFIRTWVEELGKKLGCGAMMTDLNRTYSAPYYLTQAISLEDLESQMRQGIVPSCFVPISEALPWVKKIRIQGFDRKLLTHGQIGHELRTQLIRCFDPDVDSIVQIVSQDSSQLLALVGLDPQKGFVIRRVILETSSRG